MNLEGEKMPTPPLDMDWSPSGASLLASRTHNPIRTVVEGCKLKPCPGKPMIALSLGDPTVFGNLNPHEEVICNVIESLKSSKFNGYGPSTGLEEARIAVADYSSTKNVQYNSKDIILTNGSSAAIDYCITCLANPGQNILIPFPGFPLYRTLAESLGIKTKPYNLMPTKSWVIDLNHLRSQIDENTVAILINNPSNPCGSVFSYQHLKDILQIARTHHLPIIADEIYENMVFRGQEFFPIADLSEDVPILTCSGLSKRFLVPGWRVGWIKIHDPIGVFTEIRKGLVSISQKTLGCSTIIQGALPRILTGVPQAYFDGVMDTIEKTAKLAHSLINEVKGLYPIMPQGAMYMMVMNGFYF
ncbi:tyrosine aminotransferase isoform X1 [Nilaparvata lugens]|uniref:tyrosine aminotransferase isoform X1 n=1 Tax=Nilaparvata lugens TaxID=108931 RepID=UPI00193E9D47|nr:tyrosine aminotransferase isoform X1 [Nilaparvata lugens]